MYKKPTIPRPIKKINLFGSATNFIYSLLCTNLYYKENHAFSMLNITLLFGRYSNSTASPTFKSLVCIM